jgi:hypothetical protein
MHRVIFRSFAAIATLATTAPVIAGSVSWTPASVPVDSPWAIAGLGAVVAVVAARILVNRRK